MEYDGTDFSGWQRQRSGRTVQGELERVLQKLNGQKHARVIGAGRTDSGVHATGQVANFRLEREWDGKELLNALNGNLGEDLFIHRCKIAPDDFHSRFSAVRRRYRYRCRTGRSVMDRKSVWHISENISVAALRQCGRLILGKHDFTSFCKLNHDQSNRRCIVYQSGWIKRGDFVIFTIEANRFLRHMIRYLVGTMMEVAKGGMAVKDFQVLLNAKDPQSAVFKAPARGLYLETVSYE